MSFEEQYNREVLLQEANRLFPRLGQCGSLDDARAYLLDRVAKIASEASEGGSALSTELIRVRDCAEALSKVFSERSDLRQGFSVARALWEVVCGEPREDLQAGFFAELIHWGRGLEHSARFQYLSGPQVDSQLTGREAAVIRSAELDRLWTVVDSRMSRFGNGLSDEACVLRKVRKEHILETLGATDDQWNDWQWQIRHLVTDADALARLVSLSDSEHGAIEAALREKLPFAVTPHYTSLMDDPGSDRDRAIRAQVIPTRHYVEQMSKYRGQSSHSCDFMLETDTSPIELITRRYPATAILKPYITCPQICVYCQRNWEIDQAMSPGALATDEAIDAAIDWLKKHPAIREILVTGGDPFVLHNDQLERILERIAAIPHVDMIRLGTRTPITLPMRIDESFAAMLGSFRELGRRDLAVITHIEHPYELTFDTARAVDLLRRNGIAVYNQHVYTFHVSRRFESAMLRMLLRPMGVDPYYTFAPKGKEETNQYRVPIARLMQEQKEEARLIPGMRRTDEAVYNVPGLGKNYLRAWQHRDLITVLPDGARVYEFHPWEKNLVQCETYLTADVPILDYLARLRKIGEDPVDYESIWFYF